MIGRLHCPLFIALLVLGSRGLYAQCNASAGPDLSICDGDGSNSNYTYLDGTSSEVPEGEIEQLRVTDAVRAPLPHDHAR